MKNVLITGAESYIGSKVREYLELDSEGFKVDELDVRYDSWRECDFSKYDVVYHVAAIVHRNEKEVGEQLYYKVNRDLAFEIAEEAKESGVKQFIFMSTMSVYGLIYSNEDITLETECNPVTSYGKSKLEAEKLILDLQDEKFNICIVRPPMVYGETAPGNMSKLISLVKKVRIFPKFYNERSYITVNTMAEFIRDAISNNESGVFIPQEEKYLCTYDFIREYMEKSGIKVHYTKLFNLLIKGLIGRVNLFTKCFGNLKYKLERS